MFIWHWWIVPHLFTLTVSNCLNENRFDEVMFSYKNLKPFLFFSFFFWLFTKKHLKLANKAITNNHVWFISEVDAINAILINSPILLSLKTQEKQFFWYFQGIWNENIGWKWVRPKRNIRNNYSHMCYWKASWSEINLQNSTILLKQGSITDIFLNILRNFLKTIF